MAGRLTKRRRPDSKSRRSDDPSDPDPGIKSVNARREAWVRFAEADDRATRCFDGRPGAPSLPLSQRARC